VLYSVWRSKATRAEQQHGRLTRLIERAFVGRGFTDLERRRAKARYFQSKDALVAQVDEALEFGNPLRQLAAVECRQPICSHSLNAEARDRGCSEQ
jgi:hypothetical protein